MQLTKKTETEVLKIYDAWMHSYLHGDVETYNSFLDDDYHFIGSAKNEEFLNRKDTTKFFEDTGDQFAGKTELRDETKTIEQFEKLIFITHIFDGWFLNENDWTYYARFRFTSVLKNTQDGWRFIYQHFSIPDSKTEEGETIGYDKINDENQELREAITRRTFELEAQKRELEIEGALGRIRAQATAMKASTELLDIVVSMRNEFIKLGHQAHYFWHMMWLPNTYEKAMTSGDGTRIGFVMTLPRHIHGNISLLANWEKSKVATVVYAMNTEEAIDYVDKMVDLGDFQNIDPQAPSHDDIRHIGGLTFIMARTTHGEIGYSLPGIVKNPPKEDLQILERFADAFDLAHRRFLDLQKAEQQAREVEIELALERVRSRTMAMQHSDELQEASFLLDEQVRGLGIETWGCAFNIYGEKDSTEWFGNEAGVLPTYRVPRKGIFKEYYNRGQKGESLYVKEFSGDACVAHYEYMSSLPIIGDILKNLKEANNGFPTYQIDHVVFFKYGYLLFITREHVPDAYDIFKRFTKVFEQTYTRFLDLQKAEAQAREAQIEAALERVRSRSMAMHKTSELQDVINTVYQQLTGLKLALTGGSFIAVNEEIKSEICCWGAGGTADYVDLVQIPFMDLPIYTGLVEGIKKGPGFFTESFSEEEKHLFFEGLFKNPPYLDTPPEQKQEVMSRKGGYTRSCAVSKYTSIFIINHHGRPFSEEENSVLKRFAKVFEQSYTRFLDLQKAEEQAREAQIEASLERVRSRAMAIRQSNELVEVIQVIFHELGQLDINLSECSIVAYDTNPRDLIFWSAGSIGAAQPSSTKLQYIDHPILVDLFKDFENGVQYRSGEFSGEILKTWWNRVFSETDFRNAPKEFIKAWKKVKTIFYSQFAMTHGFLEFLGEEPLQEEKVEILKRFTKVIDLTYTRYDDVVKAEAQAREAQIEAALERVRASTMAMHDSQELAVTNAIVVAQTKSLINSLFAIGIHICHDDEPLSDSWIGDPEEGQMPYLVFDHSNDPLSMIMYNEWKNGNSFHIETMEGKALMDHFQFMGTQVPNREMFEPTNLPTRLDFHFAYFSNGFLVFVTTEECPEQYSIFKRLGNVFDQTYKRFLDLQKAEAQAREAQIELGLERVRARAMAMQSTNELSDLVGNLLHELTKLDFSLTFCIINIINEGDKSNMVWAANPEEGKAPESYYMKFEDYPFHHAMMREWKEQTPKFIYVMEGEEKEIYDDYLYTDTEFRRFPKDVQTANRALDKYVSSFVFSKFGGLQTVGDQPLSDESLDILYRFGKVFDLTYTRFNDLQKAEEQAREAKVEAAMERVRSRSLAMNKSEELSEVILEIHKKFKELDISMESRVAIVVVLDSNSKNFNQYVASNNLSNIYISTPYFEHPILDDFYAAKEAGVEFFSKAYTEEEKNSYFKRFFETSFQDEIEDFKEQANWVFEQKFYTHSQAFQKNSCIGMADYSGIPLNDFEIDTIKRFSKVFDQAYTRFLDLKKAEAQAREAQIEAALERVRSRSMAMHQSEEIGEVAKVLFQQLKSLGGELWGSGFGFCEEDSEEDNFWFVTETGVSPNVRIPNTTDPAHKQMYEGWKNKQDFFSTSQGGEKLAQHYKYMLSIPDIQPIFQNILDQGISFPSWQAWHAAYFKYGYLLAITTESYENEAILKRFAKVFEQAYTRFLDLQKAEAQAREAQIVASLERVRAATMAMHQSKELSNVLSTLFGQYDILGVNPSHAVLTLINKEKNTLTFRTTGKNGYEVYAEQEVDLNLYDSWIDTTEKWKKSNPNAVNVNEYPPEVLPDVWEVYKDVVNAIPKKARPEIKDFPEGLFITEGYCQFGYIGFAHSRKPTEEEKDIVRRFAVEFGSLYQRFLDLQKAEAQAREAQIEVALEKIRSRTMAMQKGEEVKDVVVLLYKELIALGVTNFTSCGYVEVNEETERQLTYVTGQGGDSLGLFYLPMQGDKVFDERYAAWKKQEAVFHQTVGGKARKKHLEYAITTFNSKEAEEMVLTQFPDPTVFYCFNFSHGYLHIVGGSRLTTEEEALMARFTRVFEQTYARFLDLKKAEIQTREAQINLAVERVRAKALAMHKSEEIMEVVAKLKDEVMGLDIPGVVAATIFLEADNNYIRMWDLSALERSDKGYLAITDITFKLKKIDPNLYIKRVWENNENYFVDVQNAKDLDRIIEFMYENNQLEVAQEVEEYTKSTNLQELFHASKRLNNGKLCIDLLEPPAAEMEAILDKIGAAFDLAYQRFLDLQKAEAQTKESQIEAALEKVRSRSLAMQKPDELQEVVAIVAEKLKELGVIFDAGGVILCTYFPDNKDVVHWIAVPDFSSSGRYYVPYFDNPIFNDAWESKIRGDAYFSQNFPVEVKNHFFEHTFKHSDYRDMPEDYKQFVLQAESHALSAAWSKNSAILIPSLTGVVPSENDAQIMQRFAKVFEQAYIRFMDLQQAEIREKEAIKQASLDRVRGEIASMRTTKDLERITPLIWKELTTLGVPFFRCGVFIIREDEKMVHAYLSKPDGTSVAALHIPFSDTDNKLIKPTIENWRLQQVYKETWNQNQFIQQTHLFLEKGQIENPEAYDISEAPPEQLVLHLIPFKQGMVYVGNHENLTEDQINLVESLSTAFSVAYSRYEDFKALETAKNSLELTINDLKSAQAQLIQAEKMASLGELTAGIAHEIQNPLNFVNNFSEVSEELVDEMNEELENGDLEEAKAISKDLKDNLSKINHHGKRADAIVKGMLEHSRINKGEKKTTDINALLDEFVRLSYHGLRAKDKSFNADFKLKLDPNLPKVNVVSSDIGRVILNLVNNAFYACTERSLSKAEKQVTSELNIYKPEVIVSSKQTEHGIELSVKDNGGGIPEQVKDKIFQPFFTTKPTGKGTGLGLSLSYDIIKAHQGKLTLESSEGEGTLFSIKIPIQ